MVRLLGFSPSRQRGFARVPRLVWHSLGLVLAALMAWAIWRGYQNPDLLLDLGTLRLC